MFDQYEYFEEDEEDIRKHTKLTLGVYEDEIDKILEILDEAGIWIFSTGEEPWTY